MGWVIIGIDPGKMTGWARFENKRLVSCGVLKHDRSDIPRELLPDTDDVTIVIEKPRIYPFSRQKGDPNDLIDVAIKAGWFVCFYQERTTEKYNAAPVVMIEPRAWKGSAPKEVHGRRIIAALDDDERSRIPLNRHGRHDHNTVDAIGLCLWKSLRLVV